MTNKKTHVLQQNGVSIVRTPTGVGVMFDDLADNTKPVDVELLYCGKKLKTETLQPRGTWRNYLGSNVDHLRLVIRVVQEQQVLAELSLPDEEQLLPFMVRQGSQKHITENYVSVPPALTITDDMGAIWTLGFKLADKENSPVGEFAFDVLRDGEDMHEIASRIERRNGKIRIFTRHGWKRWNQDGLYFV